MVVDYRGRSGGMRVMCVRAGMRVNAEGGHAFGTDGVALGSPAAEETSPAPGCSCCCHGGDVGAAGSSSEHFDLFDVGCLWLMYVCVCVCVCVGMQDGQGSFRLGSCRMNLIVFCFLAISENYLIYGRGGEGITRTYIDQL